MNQMKLGLHVLKIGTCITAGGAIALTSLTNVWNTIPGNCAGASCPDPSSKSLWLGIAVLGVCLFSKGIYDIFDTKDYAAEKPKAAGPQQKL